MQVAEMDTFQYLEPLNDRQTVFLVRDAHSSELFSARKLNAEQASTYRRLFNVSIPHTPVVRYLFEDASNYLEFEDYIPGVSLDAYLQENAVDANTSILIAIQLCEALSALHGLGIIHRDIKPANVLVTRDHQSYLIDFDISRIAKPAQGQDTELLGTRGYAAPEQFGFQQTDARADIYALGVLLNVMVTGHFPHEGLADGTLGKVIARCVSIDPADRYEGASALRQALCNLLKGDSPDENQAAASLSSPKSAFANKVTGLTRAIRHFHLNQVPGFRSGNLFFETIALLFYSLTAIMAIVFINIAFQSLDDFILVVALFLLCGGWYVFVFDLHSVRTKIHTVEKHRGEPFYIFYCGCAMAMWFILIFAALFLIFGLWGGHILQ